MKPSLFICGWKHAVMLHYRVPAEKLQSYVPFELDLWQGHAYLSCVAFTLVDMRLRYGGCWTRWLTAPIATHPFLNLRAYVKHEGMAGIYFLREWLPNRLSLILGPTVYGLPYQYGQCRYNHDYVQRSFEGCVTDNEGLKFQYQAHVDRHPPFQPCETGTLSEFLCERYHAFTRLPGGRLVRRFDVDHAPWPQVAARPTIQEDALLHTTGAWIDHADCVLATVSPGFDSVHMGRPILLKPQPGNTENEHAIELLG